MLGFLGNKLKLYGLAILGALLFVLGALAKVFKEQRDRARQEARVAKAGLERRAETEEREAEIDQKWSDWERAAKEDIDVVPDIIAHPRKRRS